LHKPTHRPKIAKELPPLPPEKNYFLKFPSLIKNLKPQPHSRHKQTKHNPTMTAKLSLDKDYGNSTDKTPAGNSTYKKLAVQCSADTFVVNQTLILRINIRGENRQLLVAANRYRAF